MPRSTQRRSSVWAPLHGQGRFSGEQTHAAGDMLPCGRGRSVAGVRPVRALLRVCIHCACSTAGCRCGSAARPCAESSVYVRGAPFLSVSLLLCYGDTPHFKSFSKRCVVTFSHNKPELLNAYFIFESTFKNIFAVSLHVPQRDPWAPRDTFRLLPAQAVTIETVAAKTIFGLGMW